jgi:hypothetical protein
LEYGFSGGSFGGNGVQAHLTKGFHVGAAVSPIANGIFLAGGVDGGYGGVDCGNGKSHVPPLKIEGAGDCRV